MSLNSDTDGERTATATASFYGQANSDGDTVASTGKTPISWSHPGGLMAHEDPTDYDQQQDDQLSEQDEMARRFAEWIKSQGGPDIGLERWEKQDEPIPFSDTAVYPMYVHGGHLVDDGAQGKLRCICHQYPEAPFNPFWGIKNHKQERIGIEHYKSVDHETWIRGYADVTKVDRLERIEYLLAEMEHS